MAVKLRLRRIGKKKNPHYRIVAIDSRVSRDGKYIDYLGNYDPLENPPEISVDEQKALLWLNRGAIPTDTVRSLFRRVGIMMKWHMMKENFSPEKIEEEIQKWELLRTEKQKREEALKIQKQREQEEIPTIEKKGSPEQEEQVIEKAEKIVENIASVDDNAELHETATDSTNSETMNQTDVESEEKTE